MFLESAEILRESSFKGRRTKWAGVACLNTQSGHKPGQIYGLQYQLKINSKKFIIKDYLLD